jgi:hypothetical protein
MVLRKQKWNTSRSATSDLQLLSFSLPTVRFPYKMLPLEIKTKLTSGIWNSENIPDTL